MRWNEELSAKDLETINRKYIDEIKSLDKTTSWIEEEYGITVSRSQLTNAFRNKGLPVRKANGQTNEEYVPINKYRSPLTEFASAMVNLALQDLYKYKHKNGTLIDYLSACHLLTTHFYDRLVDTLLSASPWKEDDIDRRITVPVGIMVGGKIVELGVTLEDIQLGNELYTDQYNYHVGGI